MKKQYNYLATINPKHPAKAFGSVSKRQAKKIARDRYPSCYKMDPNIGGLRNIEQPPKNERRQMRREQIAERRAAIKAAKLQALN